MCWMMFEPVYMHVINVRKAVLQKEADYLLEIGASGSHGYIDGSMIASSKTRLAQLGFDPSKLSYTVITSSGVSGTNPAVPVDRGTGIDLTIRYPYGDLFDVNRLIGLAPPTGASMGAAGMKMSEYVP